MSSKQELSGHELELLKVALPYAQEINETEDRYPTQEEIRIKLGCREASARRIQHYIVDVDAVKLANRLEKLPVKAEDRAVVQFALGDTSGTVETHLLRETARLTKALEKSRKEKRAQIGQMATDIIAEIASLKELAKQEVKRKPLKIKATKESGLMLEIATPDLHVGKLAWSPETGNQPYDTKIACATFVRALEKILERTSSFTFDEILFVVGNDLLNSDNPENTTTAGTAVSTDGRFHKTFWKVREMMVAAVERLRQVAKVRVVICPGNHDLQTAFHLGDSLECYFHNDDRVVVDNSPKARKYVEWGKCLVGFTHGHEGRRADYALLMASEEPEAWGRTKFREIHTGHYHKMQVEEYHGVRVRILSALCPPDDWHSQNGYVGNQRTAEGIIWSKTEGIIGTVVYNADADTPITTKRELV